MEFWNGFVTGNVRLKKMVRSGKRRKWRYGSLVIPRESEARRSFTMSLWWMTGVWICGFVGRWMNWRRNIYEKTEWRWFAVDLWWIWKWVFDGRRRGWRWEEGCWVHDVFWGLLVAAKVWWCEAEDEEEMEVCRGCVVGAKWKEGEVRCLCDAGGGTVLWRKLVGEIEP